MVENPTPKATNKLPDKRTEFTDGNDKAQYVSTVLQISNAAMTTADDRWNKFLWAEA